jgi:hypothetical protein
VADLAATAADLTGHVGRPLPAASSTSSPSPTTGRTALPGPGGHGGFLLYQRILASGEMASRSAMGHGVEAHELPTREADARCTADVARIDRYEREEPL